MEDALDHDDVVWTLLDRAADQTQAPLAMQFSQAALNAAHALQVMAQVALNAAHARQAEMAQVALNAAHARQAEALAGDPGPLFERRSQVGDMAQDGTRLRPR